MRNIVIGIEGLVGAGKTSICRELLKQLENSVLLNGGNLYRAIVYALLETGKSLDILKKELEDIDIKQFMDIFNIELKIENNESVFYINNKKISEEDLQNDTTSIAVSKIGKVADNKKLFEFAKQLIETLKQEHNIIISGRAIMKIYPNIDYHIFVIADRNIRVARKFSQYNGEVSIEDMEKSVELRDEIQRSAGFYKIYDNTITVDVSKCKTVKESVKIVRGDLF